MERDQKKYANAGHSQSTQHGNYNTSTPSDGCMNGITILDTNNVVVADAPQSIDKVTSDGKRSDDNVYNTGPMSSSNTKFTTPRALQDSTILSDPLNDNTEPLSAPIESGDTHIDKTTSIPLHELLEETNSLGGMLETMYNTTDSEEIKQLIVSLVTLDLAIAEQSHLNEVHEAHTGKNFREQLHLNKDRKLRLQETINSVNTRVSRTESRCMTLEMQVKQGELRGNSHGIQIQGLNDRARMLAEGGEWAESEISEMKQNSEELQEEVEILKLDNKGLRQQVEGVQVDNKNLKQKVETLEMEVNFLKENDEKKDKRLAAVEQLLRDTLHSQ
jgi:chromosome segregation ATPase